MTTIYNEISFAELEGAMERLITSRRDWQGQPGFVFETERYTYLSERATRLKGLEAQAHWYRLTHRLSTPLFEQGQLSVAQHLASYALAEYLEGCCQQIRSHSPNFPTARWDGWVENTHDQADREWLVREVQARVFTLHALRDYNLECLKSYPPYYYPHAPETAESFLPLGIAIGAERERRALMRYLLWLTQSPALLSAN